MTLKVGTKVFGAMREVYINGETYRILPNKQKAEAEKPELYDAWRYELPTGESFTHPDKFGALLMCLKHAGGGEWADSQGGLQW